MYYLNNNKRFNLNNVMAVRCKHSKSGCGWTGKIINILGCAITSEEYFKKSNWIMAPNIDQDICVGRENFNFLAHI